MDTPAKDFQLPNEVQVNHCIEFKLVRKPEDIRNADFFRPHMSHQIFGDRELVYGFTGLKIKLYYTAGWLEVYYGLEYATKFRDIDPDDILRKISSVYEIPIIENLDEFERRIDNDKTFKPFGDKITSFTLGTDGRQFEIFHCTSNTPGFKCFFERLETFVVWFIDAANFIEFDDLCWNYFVVYEKYMSRNDILNYAVVGLTTVYNYYAYPRNIRPRISQVLVLPPFQGQGIGSKLLTTIYDFYSPRSDVLDFTVEDPSEEFQRIRDFIDCQRVEAASYYSSTISNNGIPSALIEKLHNDLKLNKKQAIRVCEILRLKNIDTENPEEVKSFRLDVKRRLNQPYQKQQNAAQRCSTSMSKEALEEHFPTEDDRKGKLETLYNELYTMYNSVINRLRAQ